MGSIQRLGEKEEFGAYEGGESADWRKQTRREVKLSNGWRI